MNDHHDAIRLTTDALGVLSTRGVGVPRYDRSALVPRIVHIGVGGFHRAHLAVYCYDLAALGSDWSICGVGLLDSDRTMADVLAHQDHLYTLTTRHGDTAHTRVIGSIIDYVLATDDPNIASERVANETTAIVSLTVTEAGYTDNLWRLGLCLAMHIDRHVDQQPPQPRRRQLVPLHTVPRPVRPRERLLSQVARRFPVAR